MPGKQNVLLIHSVLLFVIAAFTVSQALKVSELTTSFDTVPKASSIDGVLEQQDVLRSDIELLQSKDFVSAALYKSEKVQLEKEIEALSHPLASIEMQALREDLRNLAEDVTHTAQTLSLLQKTVADRPAISATTPVRKRRTAVVKLVEPPFRVVGLERRGGESFLAVTPPQSTRLSDVTLLGTGDTQDGWRLSAIESGEAHFALPGGSRQTLKFH